MEFRAHVESGSCTVGCAWHRARRRNRLSAFLPLLILSGAAYTGYTSLNEGFAWFGTPAAVIMLGMAAIVEIAAFYIPGVDNLLDTVATPGAVVAGTIVSAAV
jgi:hypothetical protein